MEEKESWEDLIENYGKKYLYELIKLQEKEHNELQAYKDKEEKIREILKYEYSDAILGRFGRNLKYGLLQILNKEER